MLDRELARKEIFKFGSLHFPPTTQEALGALIDKLAEVSRNENHCRAIVRTILEDPGEGERWPTVKTWELPTVRGDYRTVMAGDPDVPTPRGVIEYPSANTL